MNQPGNDPTVKDAEAAKGAAKAVEAAQDAAQNAARLRRPFFAANSLIPGILRITFLVLLVIGASALVFSLQAMLPGWGIAIQPDFVDFTLVILLGMLVGFIEIVSRYQDAPFRTALTAPGLFYMLINGVVAGSALWMVRVFGWDFTPDTTDPVVQRWNEVLIAGLGSMAIFRSALFVIGKEEQEVSVGPNAILQILLDAIDKEVDRYRGQERATSVRSIMQSVHYEDAISDLTVISGALMQNLNSEDQARINIGKMRELIDGATNDDDVRKYLLGLRIMDVVGEDILRQAIGIRGEMHYRQMMEKRESEKTRQEQVAQMLRSKQEEIKARLPQPVSMGLDEEPPEPAPALAPAPAPAQIPVPATQQDAFLQDIVDTAPFNANASVTPPKSSAAGAEEPDPDAPRPQADS